LRAMRAATRASPLMPRRSQVSHHSCRFTAAVAFRRASNSPSYSAASSSVQPGDAGRPGCSLPRSDSAGHPSWGARDHGRVFW
jgi:hypothetical protein